MYTVVVGAVAYTDVLILFIELVIGHEKHYQQIRLLVHLLLFMDTSYN